MTARSQTIESALLRDFRSARLVIGKAFVFQMNGYDAKSGNTLPGIAALLMLFFSLR
jgi:hypothetical protein